MSTSTEIEAPPALRRKRRALARGAVVASAVALACAASLLSSPVSQADLFSVIGESAEHCPEVQVVFARGTGEPSGVGRVGEAFVSSLRTMATGESIAVYAVDYPASYDFMRAMDGVNDAAAFVQNTAATCPQTKMVLGGYSQGSAVVDVLAATGRSILGFTNPLPASVADHVAAVAVFGNPSNRIGEPLAALSPLYGSKAIDLCNGADPVCSNGDDRDAHSLYVEAGMAAAAAQFVAGRLTGAQPVTQLAADVN